MFGQQASTPFGSPPATNPTPFGTQTNTAPAFGGGAAFGTTAAAPSTGFGGFGSPAPAPSGFGGFGAPAPAPTGFGAAPAAFGSPAAAPATTGFGAAAPSTTPFGAAAPGGGIFGGAAPAPAPGGLFGGGATTTGGFGTTPAPATGGFGGFGATNTTNTASAFGAPSTGGFGAPAPAPAGLFGSAAPAPSAFGTQPSTTTAFGTPAPAAGGLFGSATTTTTPPTGGFGAPNTLPGSAAGGTRIAQYQVTNRTDGTSSISLHAISAAPAYENKSAEELRYEDYSMGNKGSGGATATTGFGGGFGAAAPAPTAFGAPAPAPGGLFGSAPAPAPGAFGSTGGGFGAPTPAPGAFGAPAPAPFGATPAPTPGGLGFGAQAPAPAAGGFGGGFGAAQSPAPLFGGAPAPAPGGLFGSTPAAPTPAPGLFGSTPAAPAPGLFGAAAAPSTGLFGNPAPAPSTGLFGQSSAPAPTAFGATPAATPSTGLFGGSAAPGTTAFGAPAPATGGIFGSTAPPPAGGGLFAAKPPGTGLFGSPAPAAGGFFSGPTPAPTPAGLFGSSPATAAAPFAISSGAVPATVVPQTTDTILLQQLAAVENQRKDLEKLEVWRGRSPAGSSVVPRSLSESESRLSSYSATSMGLAPYRASPKSSAQIRPRGFGPTKSPPVPSLLGTRNSSPIMSPEVYVGSSVKRLVIKPDALTPKPSRRLMLTNGATDATAAARLSRSGDASPLANGNAAIPAASPAVATRGLPTASTTPPQERDIEVSTPAPQNGDTAGSGPPHRNTGTPTNGVGYDFYQQVVSPSEKPVARKVSNEMKSDDFLPKLTKAGYTMMPSPEEMSAMSEADLAAVTGFAVLREGYGSVSWDGAVDVRGVNLDTVVSIEERDVGVYDDEEAAGTKPPVGSKLNRPAVLTMYKVFPKQGPGAGVEVMEKFERKLANKTAKMGAEFLSYDSESGEWKFRVKHFSRYRLQDDSDDEEEDVDMENLPEDSADANALSRESNFEQGERGGRSPMRTEHLVGEDLTEESMGVGGVDATPAGDTIMMEEEDDIVALVSDAESGEAKVLQAAEDAYAMFSNLEVNDQTGVGESAGTSTSDWEVETRDTTPFPDEGGARSDYGEVKKSQAPPIDYPSVKTASGICSKLAKKCGLKSDTGSGTDFGMRMGRSFRVGWRPDGTFVSRTSDGNGGVLVVRRPVFTEELDTAISQSTLQNHFEHSSKDSTSIESCPFFSLPKTVDAFGGTPSSQVSWCGAVTGYIHASSSRSPTNVDDPEQAKVVTRAYSLLMCLYGLEKAGSGDPLLDTDGPTNESSFSRRRVQAFANWLKEACANDVQGDIWSAEQKNNTHSAILAALAGGDMQRACQIAAAQGYLQLAAMLSSGISGRDYLREQVKCWHESGAASHVPTDLLRIYTLLSGDVELEENLYSGSETSADWRRHLAMYLFYGSDSNAEQNLIASLIHQYGRKAAAGVAPFPFPRYVTNSKANDREDCLLYRLLQLYSEGAVKADDRIPQTLSDIVSPAGHTASRHDLSHAFHLASIISAIGCCRPLTPFEKATLIDSYATQLIDAGFWEGASYVYLCLMGDEFQPSERREELHWRKQQAKNLVLQNFCSSDPSSSERRSFLEQRVGVPSAWFEEALSDRCAYVGDVRGYVIHLSNFSPERARSGFEDLFIPNLLFIKNTEQSLRLLELFGSEDGTLGAAIYDLFRLSQEVQRLSQVDPDQGKACAPRLLELSASVQATLLACKADQVRIGSRVRLHPRYRVVSRDSFLAEALAVLSFLQFQLNALKAGIAIFDERREASSKSIQLKAASQLAYLSTSQSAVTAQDDSSSQSILKSLV